MRDNVAGNRAQAVTAAPVITRLSYIHYPGIAYASQYLRPCRSTAKLLHVDPAFPIIAAAGEQQKSYTLRREGMSALLIRPGHNAAMQP